MYRDYSDMITYTLYEIIKPLCKNLYYNFLYFSKFLDILSKRNNVFLIEK